MDKLSIFIGYDPCGVSWLGQDFTLSHAEKTRVFAGLEDETLEIYEVVLMRGEEEVAGVGYIIADNGHEGTYLHPSEIREEALQGAAWGLWAGAQAS